MRPNADTIAEFLRRIGHPVVIIAQRPVDPYGQAIRLWPAECDDPIDAACGLARDYHSIYVNLNPLAADMLKTVPAPGVSVRDAMIAKRTRLLIDVDGHDMPKETAREQADAIRAELGEPLIATDSGNGYGLIYPIDLPNDDASTYRVKTYLARLKERFPCVDASVSNPARLTRLIGTLNRDCRGNRIPTSLRN